MIIPVNDQRALGDIEEQLNTWFSNPKEEVKEFRLSVAGKFIPVVLYRGRLIYLMRNSPTPSLVENTLNVSTNDLEIQKIFKNYFPKVEKENNLYYLPRNEFKRFQIKFFASKPEIYAKIKQETEEFARYESPQWGIGCCCVLI